MRSGPTGHRGVRRGNLALVLGEIAEGSRSRADLAAITGLTRPAVSSLVDELTAARLVTESGPAEPSGRAGRPGTALALDPQGPAGLGAEIGLDHLGACVVDLCGGVRARRRVGIRNRGRHPEGVLADLAELLRQVASGEPPRPAGLTVAVPGPVGAAEGVLERSPGLGWPPRVPVAAALRVALRETGATELAALPITVENDANLGALAELRLADRPTDLCHLLAGPGLGAAFLVDGRLLRGARGFAGEIAHLPVRPDGPACPCGARGCLEQYAGETAVLGAAGLGGRGGRGRADWIEALAQRAAAGDTAVRGALATAGAALGIAAAGVVDLVDPGAVVLGGGYGELGEWVVPAMREEMARRITTRPWQDDWLAASPLGRHGPLLGAALHVTATVIADPGLLTDDDV
ncbi:ROK family transcriptional regulator [Kitasatospora camelliae]|uniref:ROK family transcriptional regulator n=1 Tax=Kitasatospora camelliae TaxID=3156397 RepID=A0AAU8K257_9ACTN